MKSIFKKEKIIKISDIKNLGQNSQTFANGNNEKKFKKTIQNFIKKSGLKYFIKTALSVAIILYIIFAPLTVFNSLKKAQAKVNQEIQIDYMGIIELWNIDTFEGGSKSRTSFLEKQAISFEKEHTGCYIMVYSLTPEQAKINFSNGKKPDMISFGIGTGEDIRQNLIKLNDNFDVRSDLIVSGICDGDLLAVPYMLGGYVLIGDESINNNIENHNDNNSQQNSTNADILGFGDKSYNNFAVAVSLNSISYNTLYEANQNIDSFTAYDKFLSKKFDSLCGTQRDLYRVKNRIEKGNMTNKKIEYFSGFSDLIQYVGIGTDDEIKQDVCKCFIQKLLSTETQKFIKNYNMFSVNQSSLYDSQDEEFMKMEQVLSKPLKTINVFTSNGELDEIKKLSYEALKGNERAKKELLKYLS